LDARITGVTTTVSALLIIRSVGAASIETLKEISETNRMDIVSGLTSAIFAIAGLHGGEL
jgi:hypothetical protein